MHQQLIDPSLIPGRTVVPDNVTTAADAISAKADTIGQGGVDITQAWNGLRAVYSADGAAVLYSAMGPVESASERLADALRRVARAFYDYADTTRPIVRDADDLVESARIFVRIANAFTPRMANPEDFWVGFGFGQTIIEHWYEDPNLNRTNNDLVGRAYLIGERLREAADQCAADIRAAGRLSSGAVVAAATKVPDQLEAPWGATGDREESCAEKSTVFVPHLIGGAIGGLGEMGSALGALLIGYDFRSWPPPQFQMVAGLFTGEREDGYFMPGTAQQRDTYAAAWLGLAHLATGLVGFTGGPIYSEIVAPQLRDLGWDAGFVDGTQQWMRDSNTASWNMVTGLVGYEIPDKWWDAQTWDGYNGFQHWVDDPGDQAGRSVFNIASLLLPVKGGGAVAHGLEAAGDAGRLADDAAGAATRAGTHLVDGVSVVVRHGDDLAVVVDDVAGVGSHAAHDLADLRGTRPVDDIGTGADDLARRGDDSPPPSHPAHEAPDSPPSHPADGAPPPHDPAAEPPSGHPDSEPTPHDGDPTHDGDGPTRDPDDPGTNPDGPPANPDDATLPYEVDKVAIDVDLPPSPAFDEALAARDAAVGERAEAVAARDDLISELRDHGVEVNPAELTVGHIDRVITDLKAQFGSDPAIGGLLDDLLDASGAERQSLGDLRAASEDLGTVAARDWLASEQSTLLIDDVPGSGRFDLVGLSADGHTLIVVEAKGGSATLGEGRLLPDGVRAPQGSTAYFADVFRKDPALGELLNTRPDLAQGLAGGTIGVRYDLVQARGTGAVSVFDLRLNQQYLSDLLGGLR
ncbi:MAG: hypothetical protein ABIR17_10715 [Pseudolysinimonas sp.]|uniref:hypothetical protein n=1 Tax=Pseudolysinimonas sp. TaxID=2680009 RepID=UPI003266EAA1